MPFARNRTVVVVAVVALALLGMTQTGMAQIGTGLATGKYGSFNTYSAYALDPGHLIVYNQGRVFASAGLSGSRNVNLWQASNSITVAYGITSHFDILASIGTYQDLNIRSLANAKDKQATTPGDMYVALRGGSFDFSDGSFGLGGALTLRVPTGGQNNIPFEVYKSDGVEFGLMSMASYYGNAYYKEQAIVVNANLGWWNHLDNGRRVAPIKVPKSADSAFSEVNAMHLQYGLGIILPVSKFQIMLDMYGVAFLQEPAKYVYSRESFMYVTPGFRYSVRPWVNVGVYADILLSGTKNKTGESQAIGVMSPGTGKTKNYAPWRLGVGLGFNILPANFSSGPTEQKRKKLLDKLLEEEKGAQKASSQLDKLKSIRINAEKELEKIRLELEGNQ